MKDVWTASYERGLARGWDPSYCVWWADRVEANAKRKAAAGIQERRGRKRKAP